MEPGESEQIVAYALGRWLRKRREPGDARKGAAKIIEQLRLCGVRLVKKPSEKPPKTP